MWVTWKVYPNFLYIKDVKKGSLLLKVKHEIPWHSETRTESEEIIYWKQELTSWHYSRYIGNLVQFSHSVLSEFLWPSGLQHIQASLSFINSRSLLKLMSIESVMPSNHLILCCPLLLLPLIFPSIRSFPVSQFFAPGGQSIGVSASTSVLPMNIQDWFPLGWTAVISLQSKRLLRVFTTTTVQKHSVLSFLYSPTLTSVHDYWKNCSFD